MNRIDSTFAKLRKQKRKAFIAYLTVGFPDLETNLKLVREMEKRGVDIVELGIPFSDPIADGPTIQASSQAALEGGTTFADALCLAAEIRQVSGIPLVMMGYLNPFLSRSPGRLARELSRAGVDGVIIPDLPPEASDPIRLPLRARGVHTIFLLAPTSGPERMKLVAEKSGGFIYYVSRTGVTGAQESLSRELGEKVRRNQETDRPADCRRLRHLDPEAPARGLEGRRRGDRGERPDQAVPGRADEAKGDETLPAGTGPPAGPSYRNKQALTPITLR